MFFFLVFFWFFFFDKGDVVGRGGEGGDLVGCSPLQGA